MLIGALSARWWLLTWSLWEGWRDGWRMDGWMGEVGRYIVQYMQLLAVMSIMKEILDFGW